jgi:hypothetical protein
VTEYVVKSYEEAVAVRAFDETLNASTYSTTDYHHFLGGTVSHWDRTTNTIERRCAIHTRHALALVFFFFFRRPSSSFFDDPQNVSSSRPTRRKRTTVTEDEAVPSTTRNVEDDPRAPLARHVTRVVRWRVPWINNHNRISPFPFVRQVRPLRLLQPGRRRRL